MNANSDGFSIRSATAFFAAAILCVLFGVTSAAQADTWQMVTDDFVTHTVRSVTLIDDNGVHAAADDPPIGFDHLLELRRTGGPGAQAPAGKFLATLSSNSPASRQYLAGEPTGPVGLAGGMIQWTEPILGRLAIPMNRLSTLAHPGVTMAAAATEDRVDLANGDTLRGIVADISAAGVAVQSASGDTTTVPLDAIVGVCLASVGQGVKPASLAAAEPPDRPIFRVTLTDGTSLTASAIRLPAGPAAELQLTDALAPAVPWSAVVSVEQINGPVVWLSSLTPVAQEQTPLIGNSMPAQPDRSVLGGPMRFAGQTFAHGWGVHARSVLTFSISPSFDRFRTTYAIDGQAPDADLTVRIRLDGAVAYERTHVHAGQMPPPILLDISGHKQLTLEADFGDTADVQARLNWIEPAMLRGATGGGSAK